MNLGVIGWGTVDWIGLIQDRYKWRALMNAVMYFPISKNARKLSSGCTTGGLSSGTQLDIQ
jgi:hypothetical protein